MNDHDVEQLLSSVPRPPVHIGSHQSALKALLVEAAQQRQKPRPHHRPRWSIVAGCGVLLLAAAGWAAQQAYMRYFVVDTHIHNVQRVPDGSTLTEVGTTCITTDDPTVTQQDANNTWHAVEAAIADGDYVLIDIVDRPTGRVYCYSVLLDNGDAVPFGTSRPLP